jgi:hypothetical protein
MCCALDHCRSRSPVSLVRYGSVIVAACGPRGLRRRVGILHLGDAREPVLFFGRPDTTGARASRRHRRPVSLGSASGLCRGDPCYDSERARAVLLAGDGSRCARRAAPHLANDCRGPNIACRAAGLRRLRAACPLAVAARSLVTSAMHEAVEFGRGHCRVDVAEGAPLLDLARGAEEAAHCCPV